MFYLPTCREGDAARLGISAKVLGTRAPTRESGAPRRPRSANAAATVSTRSHGAEGGASDRSVRTVAPRPERLPQRRGGSSAAPRACRSTPPTSTAAAAATRLYQNSRQVSLMQRVLEFINDNTDNGAKVSAVEQRAACDALFHGASASHKAPGYIEYTYAPPQFAPQSRRHRGNTASQLQGVASGFVKNLRARMHRTTGFGTAKLKAEASERATRWDAGSADDTREGEAAVAGDPTTLSPERVAAKRRMGLLSVCRCAMCDVEFVLSKLPTRVSHRAIMRLREGWRAAYIARGHAPVPITHGGTDAARHIPASHLYDSLPVCRFCSQFFGVFLGERFDEPSPTRARAALLAPADLDRGAARRPRGTRRAVYGPDDVVSLTSEDSGGGSSSSQRSTSTSTSTSTSSTRRSGSSHTSRRSSESARSTPSDASRKSKSQQSPLRRQVAPKTVTMVAVGGGVPYPARHDAGAALPGGITPSTYLRASHGLEVEQPPADRGTGRRPQQHPLEPPSRSVAPARPPSAWSEAVARAKCRSAVVARLAARRGGGRRAEEGGTTERARARAPTRHGERCGSAHQRVAPTPSSASPVPAPCSVLVRALRCIVVLQSRPEGALPLPHALAPLVRHRVAGFCREVLRDAAPLMLEDGAASDEALAAAFEDARATQRFVVLLYVGSATYDPATFVDVRLHRGAGTTPLSLRAVARDMGSGVVFLDGGLPGPLTVQLPPSASGVAIAVAPRTCHHAPGAALHEFLRLLSSSATTTAAALAAALQGVAASVASAPARVAALPFADDFEPEDSQRQEEPGHLRVRLDDGDEPHDAPHCAWEAFGAFRTSAPATPDAVDGAARDSADLHPTADFVATHGLVDVQLRAIGAWREGESATLSFVYNRTPQRDDAGVAMLALLLAPEDAPRLADTRRFSRIEADVRATGARAVAINAAWLLLGPAVIVTAESASDAGVLAEALRTQRLRAVGGLRMVTWGALLPGEPRPGDRVSAGPPQQQTPRGALIADVLPLPPAE